MFAIPEFQATAACMGDVFELGWTELYHIRDVYGLPVPLAACPW